MKTFQEYLKEAGFREGSNTIIFKDKEIDKEPIKTDMKKYNEIKLINAISKITNLNNSSFKIIKLKYLPRTSNNKISYNKLKKINARL